MKYQAVIFDLDGVICSTDQYHYQAWKAVADELNIPFDETVNHRLRGVSRMESFEIILEKYDAEMSREEKVSWMEKKKHDLQRAVKKYENGGSLRRGKNHFGYAEGAGTSTCHRVFQ